MTRAQTTPRTKLTITGLAAALALVGCVIDDPPPPGPPPGEETARARVVASSFSDAAGAATAFASAFATTDGDSKSGAEEGSSGSTDKAGDEGGASPEEDVSGSLVVDPACVTVEWVGLSVTIHFADCVLAATNVPVDGSMTLALSLVPATLSASFEDLTIGDNAFHGTIALTLIATQPYWTLAVEADFSYANSSATLLIQGLQLSISNAGVAFTGSASLVSAEIDAALTANDILFAPGDCLPTSGSLSYSDGSYAGTITFLATTPGDGIVMLEIPPFAPVPAQLLSPCP